MTVTLRPLDIDDDADRASLIEFLTSNEFPFHVRRRVDVAAVEERIADGDFSAPSHAALRIEDDGNLIGIVVLDDLDDGDPLFDVRLAEKFRGKGLGVQALTALADYVFRAYPDVDRIEGQTRDDNRAMRRSMLRAGFVKEAHYRGGWPTDAGPRDSIAYGLLRSDHESGTVTPLTWDDEAPERAGGPSTAVPIRTDRLTLRPHLQSDTDALFGIYSRPDVVKYLLEEAWSPDTAVEKIRLRTSRNDLDGPAGALALVITRKGVVIGDVAVWWTDRERKVAEIGWVLSPDHAGQGFATEAVSAALNLAFDRFGAHRLVAQMDARNAASAALATRVGMVREGHHRQDWWSKGEWTDTLVYAMLADDRPAA
ncbi:GNAT family N-acetyltransferase [Microbacterium amylolyticum]|uniref:RimJ/RimL family protein N-acetyltransferase n=1 Tax=Microbacterium amylolyticum TaxID=936337 RepID=A0ABS4ZH70_9MICO|nr:GNAT family protein [Microbacterium amylolyticum]MBP2436630.1 RimJ/RimL family protein N-acetyltransferase [Microbacterium amylolyticum]